MPTVVPSPAVMDSIEAIARLVQLSLTPIFLLSAIAALLNVFAGRLARVADRVDSIALELEGAGPGKAERLVIELAYQRRRTIALDIAVVLGTLGGILTCGAVLVLFVGAVFGLNASRLLFTLFGGSVLSEILALFAFGFEMMLASGIVRRRSRRAKSEGEARAGEPSYRGEIDRTGRRG